ncbi:hypothetical protein MMC12_004615 [Toensbergia leucococca]|nr:hypothetical protein [Toensbergia leucococca]
MGFSSDNTGDNHHGRIVSCNTEGSDQKTILSRLGIGPDGIAIDSEHGHIYWTNMGKPMENSGSIWRVDLDGNNPTIIIQEGKTFTPKQCNIEARSRKLYWCDREGMRVMRANLDGSGVETLIQTGAGDVEREDHQRHCVGIAVDEGRGKMYWTQKGASKGNEGRIFRANLEIPNNETADRRSDIECLLENLPEPIDLDLDVAEQVLYVSHAMSWKKKESSAPINISELIRDKRQCTDRGDPPKGNSVYSIAVGKDITTSRQNILVKKLHEAIGLSLHLTERKMYIGDLGGSIYSANLDGSDEKVLVSDAGDLTGVALVEGV